MAKAKYTRGKDGYFQTKVWDGTYRSDGRKKYISLRTDKSSRALEDMVTNHNQQIKERSYVRQSNEMLVSYAQKWLEVYKSDVSKNTQAMYKNIIDKHICKVDCKISTVGRIHYYSLINETPGDRTRQQIDMVFRQIIKSAIRDKLLPAGVYDDIFGDAARIKYKAPERRPLTDAEKSAVFAAELSPADKAFLYILYGCGLRRGEALALSRFDINSERQELTVNKAIAFDGNNPYLKGTKSAHGERTVPIPPNIYDYIASYIQGISGTLLFPAQDGGYLTQSSYVKKWARIVRHLNAASKEPIVGLTAHIFRHNYCTSLCYQVPAISVKKIAQLMGDTEKMVTDVYSHIVEKKENAPDVVAKALGL